jgi:flagellar basal body-associated protein FliL
MEKKKSNPLYFIMLIVIIVVAVVAYISNDNMFPQKIEQEEVDTYVGHDISCKFTEYYPDNTAYRHDLVGVVVYEEGEAIVMSGSYTNLN